MSDRYVVVRSIDRAAQADIDALAVYGTATIHEAIGRRGFLGPDLRPIQDGLSMTGSAITVSCHPGDNLMVHAAIEVCLPGDVLVVTTTSPATHGMVGELLATSLAARGVRGLVIGAGVRDITELRAMRFPVWTRFISCEGTVKASPGSVNVPIVIGGQLVKPGDVIRADDDGVVVVPREEAAGAVTSARARTDRETATRERLAAGELGVDLYGLRTTLDALGVETVERAKR
jgi:4-hydroxy-4-methyl-2-oxoglutarate aldolase